MLRLALSLTLMTFATVALADEKQVAFVDNADRAAGPAADVAMSPPADTATERASEDEPKAAPTPTAAKYSVPFQLRSAAPSNTVRVDHVVSPFTTPTSPGLVQVTILSGSYRFTPNAAVFARAGFVNYNPDGTRAANALTNPVIGGLWGDTFHAWRYAVAFAVAPPVGAGGGNSPDPAVASSMKTAHLARFAMDGTLFAVNEFATILGGDVAYVSRGWTVQFEATAAQLFRTRGEAQLPDAGRTNFLSGAHAGYWVLKELCVASELRYQRWLSTPEAVQKDPLNRDNMSAAAGLRTSIEMKPFKVMPGLAYATGLRGQVLAQRFHAIQFDVPFVF